MFPGSSNPREMGRYFAMGQVGLEMVVPIALGLLLDHYLGWGPWGLVGGAVFGLCGGLLHLVHLLGQEEARRDQGPKGTQEP